MTQGTLDFDPAAEPVRGLDDYPKDEDGVLTRQAAIILGRLQRGPATGRELADAAGSFRYSARIHELRRRGHNIPDAVQVRPREFVFWLLDAIGHLVHEREA